MNVHVIGALCTFLVALLLRALYLIICSNGCLPKGGTRRRPARTMIILGSGGHTTEILRIVACLKTDRYSPRIYVRASTDVISEAKVKDLESGTSDYQLLDIRRSREVHQPFLTSIWTTITATLDSIPILLTRRPDLILCNGPGTCVPLCFTAFLCKLLFIANVKVVFVESFCRVKTLSLSGKILYYFADFVVVRWKTMAMDTLLLIRQLLPSRSLLNDVQTYSPPDIRVHLTSIFHGLWTSVNSNENVRSHKWMENTTITLDACLDRTWESLNSGCWKDVSINYRYCYSFCSILKSVLLLMRIKHDAAKDDAGSLKLDTLKEIILQIDKGILLGAPSLSLPGLLPTIARKLNSVIVELSGNKCCTITDPMRLDNNDSVPTRLLPGFVPVARCYRPSMEAFHRDIFRSKIPTVLEGCMEHWRALELWRNPQYLLRTAGVRTVPIEIGSRYTEEDWTQRLITFSEFLESYVTSDGSTKLGYLAQHELFEQIPELLDDISIPDYCSFSDTRDEAATPDINAWLGPAGTISPLHFDPKNNLLCQVFGTKQVVLFDPEQTPNLYPYETRLLSNTARVDPLNPDFQTWPKFESATGTTCTLGPGEMLFIPPGWWHHVVALAPSFSSPQGFKMIAAVSVFTTKRKMSEGRSWHKMTDRFSPFPKNIDLKNL